MPANRITARGEASAIAILELFLLDEVVAVMEAMQEQAANAAEPREMPGQPGEWLDLQWMQAAWACASDPQHPAHWRVLQRYACDMLLEAV